MKKQEWNLSLRLYVCFTAALAITAGEDFVYYKCKDSPRPMSDSSKFEFKCDGRQIIIVKSAVTGTTVTDKCPMTYRPNTCLKEITIVAELCTGRNSCDFNQNVLLYNESKLSCPRDGDTVGNFINVNYACFVPLRGFANYGDICHFNEDLYNNTAVYISSYPNFPDAMGPEVNYQCSCMLTSRSSLPANVTIRALLVKLTGSFTTCSERLSIIDSGNETKLEFCSPCNNANNVTTVPLASNTAILFRRDPVVSPFNGKFILEITGSSKPSGSSSIGSIKCSMIGSTMSSATTVSPISPSYISMTTTNAILSQPSGGFSSTNVQSTTSGITLGSSNTSASSQQSTLLSSSNPASETWNATSSFSLAPSSGNGTPTPASQIASDEKSVSTGGIIGIVLGSVGLIVIVIIVVLCLLRKQKQHRNHSKEDTTSTVQQSAKAIQNTQAINNIELHGTTSSELHTLQSAAHFSDEPQTTGYENNWQPKDTTLSNYEEGAPVSDATYGPGTIQANEQKRLNYSGDGDTTLVENQLYGENDKPMTDVVASSDYAVVRPVVQYGRTDESTAVDRVYGQMKNSSADHSYYNVPAHTGSGTIHSPTEVSAEAETNSVSDEIETTNPMYKADSDVVLIDNTLYGSMLTF